MTLLFSCCCFAESDWIRGERPSVEVHFNTQPLTTESLRNRSLKFVTPFQLLNQFRPYVLTPVLLIQRNDIL